MSAPQKDFWDVHIPSNPFRIEYPQLGNQIINLEGLVRMSFSTICISYILISSLAMDLVEEFLELGHRVPLLQLAVMHYRQMLYAWFLFFSQVSVTTLMSMLGVIKKRFPRRLLPWLSWNPINTWFSFCVIQWKYPTYHMIDSADLL